MLIAQIPLLIRGPFSNEYIRLAFSIICMALGFFANEHFLLRLLSIFFNVFIIIMIEYWYFRELTM